MCQPALPLPRLQVSRRGRGVTRAGGSSDVWAREGRKFAGAGRGVRGPRGPAGEVAPWTASGRVPSPAPHSVATSQLPEVRRRLCAQLSFLEPSRAARPDNRWAAAPRARPGQARASRPQPSTEAPPGRGARSYLRHVGRATGSHRRGGSRPEPGCAPGPPGSRCLLRRRFGGNAQEPPERATTPRSAPSRRPARQDGRGRGRRARAEQGVRSPAAAVPGERARGGPGREPGGQRARSAEVPSGYSGCRRKIPPILSVGHF